MPERSFFYKGRQLPICARCTGELIGILAGIATYWLIHPTVGVAFLLLIPLILDGIIQRITPYESKNWLRLISGILFGYGLLSLFCSSIVYVFFHGYQFGLTLMSS